MRQYVNCCCCSTNCDAFAPWAVLRQKSRSLLFVRLLVAWIWVNYKSGQWRSVGTFAPFAPYYSYAIASLMPSLARSSEQPHIQVYHRKWRPWCFACTIENPPTNALGCWTAGLESAFFTAYENFFHHRLQIKTEDPSLQISHDHINCLLNTLYMNICIFQRILEFLTHAWHVFNAPSFFTVKSAQEL